MPLRIEKKLAAIVASAIDIAPPGRIILFGSAARGERVEDGGLNANRHDPCCYIHDSLREGRVFYYVTDVAPLDPE